MNKKIFKSSRVILAVIFTLVIGFFTYSNTMAQGTSVSNVTELKAALASNSPISITGNFTIDETITIPASYNNTITGNGNELTLGDNSRAMFVTESNSNATFTNITLNGNNKGRLFDMLNGGSLTIQDSTVKNGTTELLEKQIDSSGANRQRYQGGAMYIESGATVNLINTSFEDNKTKIDTPSAEPNTNVFPAPHGGALYIGGQSTVNITGGKFLRNKTGNVETQAGNHGEGGAIKIEGGSTLNINAEGDTQKDKTVFEGNSNDSSNDGGGRQGGAIEVTRATANIYATTFKIAGPFNTGGAIKFEDADGKIKNSEFSIKEGLGGIGVSAGAINSQDSRLLIEDSIFNTGLGTYMTESGGLIAVYGGGTFDLKNSTLNGSGTGWNSNWKYKTTKYGGAIVFYDDSTVVANIENSTIQNFTADISGAAIAVTTQMDQGKTASVKLKIKDTNILNNATYTASNTNYGGGLYIGKGRDEGENNNIVVIEGGRISNSSAATATAGAIYNEGHLTITGGAQIRDNWAYWEVPGILNDGYLKVDDAYIGNNRRGDWSTGNNHILSQQDKPEYGGLNIYAKKDVVITPNARFDGNDIRVIDGQSAVLLTGTLTTKVPVSVSENEKTGEYSNLNRKIVEPVHRYVGYTVAKGTEGYTPVSTDAQFIHYVTKDTTQAAAPYEDHTSTAKWDYVFNPEDKTVVLGQRAKMVYHTNDADANIANGTADDNPVGKLVEQLYTIYKSGDGVPKVSVNNKPVTDLIKITDEPTLEGYTFKSWATAARKANARINKGDSYEEYNFTNLNFANSWHKPDTSAEIRTILSPDTENTLHTYAVYERNEILTIKAKKKWDSTYKFNVTLLLKKDGQVIQRKTVEETNSDWIVFDPVEKTNNQGQDISASYTVEEENVTDTQIQDGVTKGRLFNPIGRFYDVTIKEVTNDTNHVANPEENTKYFEVENKEITSYNVTKVWDGDVSGTTPTNTADKNSNRAAIIQLYKSVDNQEPVPVEGKFVQLTERETLVHAFSDLPVLENGKVITYSAKEVEGEISSDGNLTITKTIDEGGVIEISGERYLVTYTQPDIRTTRINNAKLFSKTVKKVWSDNEAKAESVRVELYKNGQATGTYFTLNEANSWTATAQDLLALKSKTELNLYEFYELDAQNTKVTQGSKISIDDKEYTVSYSVDDDGNNIVTNTYIPPTTSISVTKVWQGEVKESSVTVQLLKNGEAVEGKTLVLNEGNSWSGEFTDLLVKDSVNAKTNEYTVKEVGETDNVLQAGDNKYTVAITGSQAEGYTITNTYVPPTTSVSVTKVWQGKVKESSVTVQLLKNGEAVEGKTVELNEGNSWSGEFADLLVKDSANAETNVYTVKEVGENNGVLKVGSNKYNVAVTGTQTVGYVITNTYEPPIPWTALEPAKTKVKVTKAWIGRVQENSVTVELVKNGTATGETLVLNAENNWTATFENLKVVDAVDSQVANEYSVKEVGAEGNALKVGDNNYKVAITGTQAEGYVITNTYLEPWKPLEPATTKVKVRKEWSGDVKETSVTVELVKNGIATGETLVLNAENNWTATFENLKVVDSVDAKVANEYSVKEVGAEGNALKVGDNNYKVAITGTQAEGYVITNTYLKPIIPLVPATTSILVTKVWEGAVKQSAVQVVLIKNGEVVGEPITLNEENSWSYIFTNLPVVDSVDSKVANEYSVKEVGEADGKVRFGNDEYNVKVEKRENTFTITNTYIEPKKEEPKEPTPPKKEEPKKPNKNTVKTGDESDVTGVLAMLFISLLGTTGLLVRRNRD